MHESDPHDDPDPTPELVRAAFERYLDVVNRAIAQWREHAVDRVLLGALSQRFGARPFAIEIVGVPGLGEMRVGCVVDRLRLFWTPLVPLTEAPRWTLRLPHIHAVLAAPWRYLAHPRQIEMPPFQRSATSELPAVGDVDVATHATPAKRPE